MARVCISSERCERDGRERAGRTVPFRLTGICPVSRHPMAAFITNVGRRTHAHVPRKVLVILSFRVFLGWVGSARMLNHAHGRRQLRSGIDEEIPRGTGGNGVGAARGPVPDVAFTTRGLRCLCGVLTQINLNLNARSCEAGKGMNISI